jgi:hypothetical protein
MSEIRIALHLHPPPKLSVKAFTDMLRRADRYGFARIGTGDTQWHAMECFTTLTLTKTLELSLVFSYFHRLINIRESCGFENRPGTEMRSRLLFALACRTIGPRKRKIVKIVMPHRVHLSAQDLGPA